MTEAGAGLGGAVIRITVPGDPVPWARARSSGRRRYTAPEQAAWMQRCWLAARLAAPHAPPGRLVLQVVAVIARPQSRPDAATREEWTTGERVPAVGRFDADNALKIVADALQERGWLDDDRRISRMTVSKVWAARGEGACVEIELSCAPP